MRMFNLKRRKMRKINLIVVHCTATPEGRDVTVADIDRMHRAKGWNPADLSRKWAPMSMATTPTLLVWCT